MIGAQEGRGRRVEKTMRGGRKEPREGRGKDFKVM